MAQIAAAAPQIPVLDEPPRSHGVTAGVQHSIGAYVQVGALAARNTWDLVIRRQRLKSVKSKLSELEAILREKTTTYKNLEGQRFAENAPLVVRSQRAILAECVLFSSYLSRLSTD
jgi:hypothetical protein